MIPFRNPPTGRRRSRETFLVVLLTAFLTGAVVLFLIFATGGFFLWVILIALALAAFSMLHYFLWGRAFHERTEAERQLLRQQEAEDRWQPNGVPGERRFDLP